MAACFASHSLAADSTSVSSTGCRLKVERLITLSTSAVVVCCSNDSLSSRLRACTSSNKRTFSMAMTAWSARGNKLDLLGGEWLRRRSCDRKCPYRASLSQKRNCENGPVTAHLLGLTISVFRIGQHIGDMNRSVLDCRPPDC